MTKPLPPISNKPHKSSATPVPVPDALPRVSHQPVTLDGIKFARLLTVTIAQHRRAENLMRTAPTITGRLTVAPSRSAWRQVRRQNTFVRLTSITESFAARQLRTRLDQAASSRATTYANYLYDSAEDVAVSSWPKMEANFKEWVGGLRLNQYPEYKKVTRLVSIRNAIVHGLGRFTPKQQRSRTFDDDVKALKGFGMAIDGSHAVHLDAPALERSADQYRDFIGWLDNKLDTLP